MKKIFLLLIGCMLSVGVVTAKAFYNGKLPLPGASQADIRLQADTLMAVYSSVAIKVPNCSKFSIIDTAMIKQLHDVKKDGDKYVAGTWSEQWTVKACGQKVYVPINFLINETGGTTYVIENSRVHF